MKAKILLLISSIFLYWQIDVWGQVPSITSFTPISGQVGASVTITGNNFATLYTNNTVYVGGIATVPIAGSATSLTFTVPAGASSVAPIKVVNRTSGRQGSSLQATGTNPLFFTVTLATPINITSTSYTASNINTTLSPPGAVSAADFNNDGWMDLAVANNGNIAILLNQGTTGLTFNTPITRTSLGSIATIVAEDVDNDGNIDIIVNNNTSVMVHRNTDGMGNFSLAGISTTVGSNASKVALADLNNDGFLDVVQNSQLGSAQYRFGDGTGSFSSGGTLTLSDLAESIALVDIDKDEDVDVLCGRYNNQIISVFLNNGSGTFPNRSDYTTSIAAGPLAVGLFNNDTFPDVASTRYFLGSVEHLNNDGSGGLTSTALLTSTVEVRYPVVADLNGDGRHDILAMKYGGGGIPIIYTNNGGTSFNPAIEVNLNANTSHPSQTTIAVADFDKDGRMDIVIGRGVGTNVVLYRNTPNDFYTIGNATWNTNGNWSNTDGGPDCGCNPAGVAGANVTIKTGHTATVSNATDIGTTNNITVEGTLTLQDGNTNPIATLTTLAGSTINISAGNFNLASPASTTINGTINRQNTGTFPNGLTFANGSVYTHAIDGGSIPTATWGANSECRVTGVSNTAIANGLNQNFGNFTWNCPAQTITQNLVGTMQVNGNFNLTNTGLGAFNLGTGNFTAAFNSSIAGNLLDNNDSGMNVFNGNVIIGTTGTWNTTAVVSDGINMRIGGNITHNNTLGGSFQAGVLRFTTGGNINGGAGAAKFIIQTLEVTSSGTRTNNHQIEVVNMSLFTPNGRLTQGLGSLLQIKDNGAFSMGIAGQTDFTTNANVVEYIGVSGDVIADGYHDLVINTTGTKSLTGDITVNSELVVQGGDFDATNNAYFINILGNFTVNSLGNFTAGNSTVRAQLTNFQTIAFIGTGIFHNFALAKSSINPVIFATNVSITNNLTYPNNGLLRVSNGTTLTVGGSTALTGVGTKILEIEGNAEFVGNAPDYSAGTLRYTGAGTKNVTGEWQNVAPAGIVDINKVGGGVLVLNEDKQIAQSLQLNNGRIQLGNFNLSYGGLEANLTRTNGWIETNGTGSFVRTGTSSATNNFYVGDATAMRNVVLSSFANPTSIRFTNTIAPATAAPNLAAGMWIMNGAGASIITLQNVGAGPIATSTIQRSDAGGAWTSLLTNPPTLPNFVTTNSITLGTDQRFTVFTESSTDFYTIGNATWNTNGNWSNTDGGPDCGCNPASVAGANVTIKTGHIATVSNATDIGTTNNITVEGTLTLQNGNTNPIATLTTLAGSTINISAGNFNLASPASTTINGTINRQNTGTFPNGLTFANGSVYTHAIDGGSIPTATWGANSECRVTGTASNMPTGWAGQTFGNLTWDCKNQNTFFAFNANFTIANTFRVQNTTDGSSLLGLSVASTGNYTITTQNFIMDNPISNRVAFYPYGGSTSGQTGTLEILGNTDITGGSATGVLSGIGRSIFRLAGSNNANFNYHAAFTFYNNAEFEIQVDKSTASVTFSSPINFISFDPASGSPASILNIQSGEAIFSNTLNFSVGTIEGTGTLTMGGNSSLFLRRHSLLYNNTFSGSLSTSTGSTVFYDSPNDQLMFIPSIGAYNNITLQNSGAKVLNDNITLLGNWQNDGVPGSFVAGASTSVEFAGVAGQSISGTTSTQFDNVIINNTSNVVLTVPTTMSRLFLSPNSYLILNLNDLTMVGLGAGTGDISAFSNGYVVTNSTGRVLFRNTSTSILNDQPIYAPVGYTYPNKFAAIELPFDNIGVGQEIAVRALQPGNAPAPAITSLNYVDAVWEVSIPPGVSSDTTSNATVFHNGTSSVLGTLGTLGKVYYHNGTNWVVENTISSDSSETIFKQSAYINTTRYYGVFTESIYYSRKTGNWSDATTGNGTWSTAGHAGASCDCVPPVGANVVIAAGHTVTTDANNQLDGKNISIGTDDGAGVLFLNNTTHGAVASLNSTATSTANAGTLRMAANVYPTITTDNFAANSFAIVEYNTVAGIPINTNITYPNLLLSGSNTRTLTSGTITVRGQLTVNAGVSFSVSNSGTTVNIENGINNFGFINFGAGTVLNVNNNTQTITGNVGSSTNLQDINFNANTTLASPIVMSILGNALVASGVTVTNNCDNLSVQQIDGLSATSTWLQGANVTLNIRGASAPMGTGILDASTNNNTVRYEPTPNANVVVKGTNYRFLIINIGGLFSATLNSNTTVGNNLTLSSGNLNMQNFNLTLLGNLSVSSANTAITGTTGEFIFAGANLQSLTANTNTSFSRLRINKTTNPVILSSFTISVNTALALENGRLQLGNFNLTYAGTLTNLTRTLGWIETNGTGEFVFTSATTNVTFHVGSSTDYQPLTLSNIVVGASVRFGIPTSTVPNSGVGSWFVTNPSIISNITISNPQGGSLMWGTSKIAIFNTSWTPQMATTYPITNEYALNAFSFPATTVEFSVFTFVAPIDYYTLANDAIWNVNSNLWSNDGTTPCNCSPNGVVGANVRIRHNATIPASASVDVGTVINIENPVNLITDQAFTAASLAGVSGARLSVTNGLPVITTNTFATTAGTIVEFAGGAGTIPNQFGTANYRNLVISGTGNKNIGSNTTIAENLTILSGTLESGSFDLLVTGNTTIAAGAMFLDNVSGGLNEFNGVVNNSGTLAATGGNTNISTFGFNNDINNLGSGTLNLDCNCPYNFNKIASPPLVLNPAGGQMIFGSNGGGNGNIFSDLTIADGQTVTFNITTAASLLIANDKIVLNNNATGGVIMLGNGIINGSNAGSTWIQGLNAMLYYGSDSPMMPVGTFDAASNANTVFYNRAGDQVLRATTYHSVVLSGTSIKSVGPGNIAFNTNFTVPDGITFQVNGGNFIANGALVVAGIWEDAASGGTNIFNQIVDVSNTGTMIVSGTNTSFFIFAGNITNRGTFDIDDSTQWRLNGNLTIQNQSPSPMNFATTNSGTGQVNGNVTVLDGIGNVFFYTNVGAPISGSGSITNQLGDNGSASGRRLILEVCQVPVTNATNAVIEYRAGTDIPTKNLNATNNLFIYTQPLNINTNSTFHHLRLAASGTVSLAGNIDINGDLTIENGAIMDASTNNINIAGNWINNGSFVSGGSVIFDGTNLQTISGTNDFDNIVIHNPAGVEISTPQSSNSITFNQGHLRLGSNDFSLNASPATNQITQTFTNTSTSYIETNGTGRLIRNNLQVGTSYVFPIGDATAIRHLSITPSTIGNASANFVTPLVPLPPPVNTDVAAGMWLLSGMQAVISFENTGCTTNNARVNRLNAGTWDATGITTTAATPIYTTNSIDFTSGETYTLFGLSSLVLNPATPTLPAGEVGIPYSFTFSATGGTAPYNFTVVASSLPDGLTLNAATGELSGTPTTAANFSFRVRVSDTFSDTTSRVYNLLINRGVQSVLPASFSYTPISNGRFELSAITTQGLQTKFFSTNTEVAHIENGNILVIVRNVGEADIMAYQEGTPNIAPSDTVLVMRVSNFSLITAINADLEKKVYLYPNPTTDKVWVEAYTLNIEKAEIYNSLGQMQEVTWNKANSRIEIATNSLSKGIYFIHLYSSEGKIVKRLIKL